MHLQVTRRQHAVSYCLLLPPMPVSAKRQYAGVTAQVVVLQSVATCSTVQVHTSASLGTLSALEITYGCHSSAPDLTAFPSALQPSTTRSASGRRIKASSLVSDASTGHPWSTAVHLWRRHRAGLCEQLSQQHLCYSSDGASRLWLPALQANPADLDVDDIIKACVVEDCRSVTLCRLADWDVDDMMKAQTLEGAQHSVNTEYVVKMLGLDICAETVVGNAMMRGISGGQKKRVTSGKAPALALRLCRVHKVWLLHANARQHGLGRPCCGASVAGRRMGDVR